MYGKQFHHRCVRCFLCQQQGSLILVEGLFSCFECKPQMELRNEAEKSLALLQRIKGTIPTIEMLNGAHSCTRYIIARFNNVLKSLSGRMATNQLIRLAELFSRIEKMIIPMLNSFSFHDRFPLFTNQIQGVHQVTRDARGNCMFVVQQVCSWLSNLFQIICNQMSLQRVHSEDISSFVEIVVKLLTNFT